MEASIGLCSYFKSMGAFHDDQKVTPPTSHCSMVHETIEPRVSQADVPSKTIIMSGTSFGSLGKPAIVLGKSYSVFIFVEFNQISTASKEALCDPFCKCFASV